MALQGDGAVPVPQPPGDLRRPVGEHCRGVLKGLGDDARLVAHDDSGDTVSRTELGEHSGNVRLGRCLADEEGLGASGVSDCS